MALTPDIGSEITEAERIEWIKNYQSSNKMFDIEWSFYGLDVFKSMIEAGSDEITGFKIAPASNKGKVFMIVSSCKSDGTILSSYEFGKVCPPFC